MVIRHSFMLLCIVVICLISISNVCCNIDSVEYVIDSTSDVISRNLMDNDISNLKQLNLQLIFDPPNNTVSPTALGVYVQVVGSTTAKIYYELNPKIVDDIVPPTKSVSHSK